MRIRLIKFNCCESSGRIPIIALNDAFEEHVLSGFCTPSSRRLYKLHHLLNIICSNLKIQTLKLNNHLFQLSHPEPISTSPQRKSARHETLPGLGEEQESLVNPEYTRPATQANVIQGIHTQKGRNSCSTGFTVMLGFFRTSFCFPGYSHSRTGVRLDDDVEEKKSCPRHTHHRQIPPECMCSFFGTRAAGTSRNETWGPDVGGNVTCVAVGVVVCGFWLSSDLVNPDRKLWSKFDRSIFKSF